MTMKRAGAVGTPLALATLELFHPHQHDLLLLGLRPRRLKGSTKVSDSTVTTGDAPIDRRRP